LASGPSKTSSRSPATRCRRNRDAHRPPPSPRTGRCTSRKIPVRFAPRAHNGRREPIRRGFLAGHARNRLRCNAVGGSSIGFLCGMQRSGRNRPSRRPRSTVTCTGCKGSRSRRN
jgi:hypothetical protein